MKLVSSRALAACAALVCSALATTAHAQAKAAVAILPVSVTANDNAYRYAARAFEGQLVQALGGLGRVSVLDRTQTDNVAAERNAQKSVDFIDSKTLAAQGQSMGAQLVMTANVDKITVGTTRLDDGTVTYQSNLSITVRLIDVSTQEIKNSAVLTADAGSGGKKGFGALMNQLLTTHKTAEDAITAAAKNLNPGMDGFFKEAFPARFTIAQVETMAPDSSQAQFLIDGGKNLGAKVKSVLSVVEVSEVKVGARTVKREREVGTIEITKLDGAELSIGQMRAGAREVAQMLTAGKTVYAIFR